MLKMHPRFSWQISDKLLCLSLLVILRIFTRFNLVYFTDGAVVRTLVRNICTISFLPLLTVTWYKKASYR